MLKRALSVGRCVHGRDVFMFPDFLALARRLKIQIGYDTIEPPALLVRMLDRQGILLSGNLSEGHAMMALALGISSCVCQVPGDPILDLREHFQHGTGCPIALKAAIHFFIPYGIPLEEQPIQDYLKEMGITSGVPSFHEQFLFKKFMHYVNLVKKREVTA